MSLVCAAVRTAQIGPTLCQSLDALFVKLSSKLLEKLPKPILTVQSTINTLPYGDHIYM